MLTAIQEMKFFLRTAFGDSKDFASSTIEIKTQGACQGNGAAPATWAVISITIIGAHKTKGHGATFVAPILHIKLNLAAILFVDDTDLIHLDMTREELVSETHKAIQASVANWGKLLIASGGTLKPIKCFYHLISFDWKPDGSWQFSNHHEDESTALFVPMPDGSLAEIEHLPVDAARKTLGVFSCPSGKSDGSIQYMQEKAQKWLDKAMVGRIHRRSIWFSLERQFWPSVGYGLCISTATLKELEAALQKKYFKVLPLGGIIRSAKREIRQLSHGFYGGGCPRPGVEAAVAQANKMLMHYGCKSGVGIEMQISCELMMAELGLSFQPFLLPYSQYQALLTHSWMKTLWEKMSEFGFELMINNITLKFPRDGDKWLMECFIAIGYKGKELIRLNRVRVHQQVLFLLDILCAAGKRVHGKYLHLRNLDEKWTNLGRFPNEDPTESDFDLWCEAINQIAPGYRLRDRLGAWQHPGHKIWEWSCSDDRQLLYRGTGSTLEVFERTATNRYTTTNTTIELETRGQICTVEEVNTGWKIISTSTPAETENSPDSFLDVLEEWGCTWMWEDLRLTGGTEWLAMAIEEESLVAVTDGSYLREMYPNLCSAAFILECNKGRGKLVGSFPEHTLTANAYRGELLGLMAVHLLLLSVNKTEPHLAGLVKIHSDCLGALSRVAELPPHKIPTRCKHSDILKNILVNCGSLSFHRSYSHVSAHQDDSKHWHELSRAEQLNCACDAGAKQCIRLQDGTNLPKQQPFPLEPVCLFIDGEKMTSDTGDGIRFAAHRKMARDFFSSYYRILHCEQFDEVDWRNVYRTLTQEVPRLFALWACKQVTRTAATNVMLSHQDGRSKKCPCCTVSEETAAHILHCPESGRVKVFHSLVDALELWLEDVDTDPDLAECIVEYARGRGGTRMEDVVRDRPARFNKLAVSQDKIGWMRFLEGMVSKEIVKLQISYAAVSGSRLSITRWISGLITRLLEITHGQWIYRNYMVHDSISGTQRQKKRKHLLQR